MKLIKHMAHNPFIFATGAAALVHSTWALGVLFAGQPPVVNDWLSLLQWLWWLLPALLIAFALDVGQIATSSEIREGGRNVRKYITFITFAFATYYLQWLYIAHHMPELMLADGVRDSWGGAATLMRDLAVWIIPALLPLSTTLYTLSGEHEVNDEPEPVVAQPVANANLLEVSYPELDIIEADAHASDTDENPIEGVSLNGATSTRSRRQP